MTNERILIMKVIKITTDSRIMVCEKKGDYSRDELEELLGCEYVENVMPRRLYNELGVPKIDAIMLVDEDGHYNGRKFNPVGSWLYETDIHNAPIVGDILVAGYSREAGICEMNEKLFDELYCRLERIANAFNSEKTK